MSFKKFDYKSLGDVVSECSELNISLPFSENLALLKNKVKIGGVTLPNSLAAHPMEGSDANADGSPGELTRRRYRRFAEGGAGLIWFEAVAVTPEGKASPRQLCINENNADAFKRILDEIKTAAVKSHGAGFNPAVIMQLTHSGRYSRPEGKPAPIIAYHSPVLDGRHNLGPDYPVITDDELERLEEKFETASGLAEKAGFDGVDVKCCHRYINSELLSAFSRTGRYGGSFEGRTRFLRSVAERLRSRAGKDFIVTTRLNAYDGIEWPDGWGVGKDGVKSVDLTEPLRLVGLLRDKGMRLINLTMGSPYYNPHVNRPFDNGAYVPDENPIEGVARLINGIGEIQKAYPDVAVVGTGFTWLRQFSPYLAAGCVEKGMVTFAGYGRGAIAYPDFADDIINNGGMKKEKCCVACSKCSDILRAGGEAGCVFRDTDVYASIYKRLNL